MGRCANSWAQNAVMLLKNTPISETWALWRTRGYVQRRFSYFKPVCVNGIKFTASDKEDGNIFILVLKKCKVPRAKILFRYQREESINLWMRI